MAQTILETDPQHEPVEASQHGPATGTLDDLLAEVAMTYPLAGYAVGADADDAFDGQILAGLVHP